MTTLIQTRPGAQGETLRRELAAQGIAVLDFPLLHIAPPADRAALQSALARLEQFTLAVPVSPTAVQATFAALPGSWPAHCAIGVVGAGSERAVRHALQRTNGAAPWPQLIVPSAAHGAGESDAQALWAVLQQRLAAADWPRQRVLLLRGESGRDELRMQLQAAGATVEVVEAYRRQPPPWNTDTAQALRQMLAAHGWWLLTSATAIAYLQDMLPRIGLGTDALAQQSAIAIHPRIARAAEAAGFGQVRISRSEPQALVAELRAAETSRP